MNTNLSDEPPRIQLSDSLHCEEAELLISRHLDGELAPSHLPALKSHLRRCAACRAQAQSWAETSFSIGDSISSLWAEEAPVLRKVEPQTPQRRAMWLPLSMIATQTAAIVGLVVYLTFFATPVQAPRTTMQGPAPSSIQMKREAPQEISTDAGTLKPVVAYSLPLEETVDPAVDLPEAPAVADSQALISNEINSALAEAKSITVEPKVEPAQPPAFAAPLPLEMPRLVPNVSMDFQIGERCARLTLFGDVSTGKAVVRITDNAGRSLDIAQADVDTLLSGADRAAVRRFIAACSTPEFKTRLQYVK